MASFIVNKKPTVKTIVITPQKAKADASKGDVVVDESHPSSATKSTIKPVDAANKEASPNVEKDPNYGKWLGGDLEKYKAMRAQEAEEKGVGKAFQAATTMTQAKNIMKGRKAK